MNRRHAIPDHWPSEAGKVRRARRCEYGSVQVLSIGVRCWAHRRPRHFEPSQAGAKGRQDKNQNLIPALALGASVAQAAQQGDISKCTAFRRIKEQG